MSTRAKRGQAAVEPAHAAADAAGPARKRATRDKGHASLEEDRIGLGAQVEAQHRLDAEIRFWQQFDTPLLSSWLGSYEDSPVKGDDLQDRAQVLNALALTEGVERPKGKTLQQQLDRMRKVFRQQLLEKGQGAEPGLFSPGGASSSTQSAQHGSADGQGQDPLYDDDDDTEMSVLGAAGARQTQVVLSPPAARQNKGQAKAPNLASMLDGGAMHKGNGPAFITACLSCCRPREKDEDSRPNAPAGFICRGCFRRGDLDAGHPTNKELRRSFEADRDAAIRAVAAKTGGSSSESGQSNKDTPAHSSISAADRRYVELAARGGDFDLFVGEAAGAKVPYADALETSRLAFNGQSYERPSDQLVQLIRAGKLPAVGWAVPKKRAELIESTTLQLAQLAGGGLGIAASAKGATASISCASAQQFSAAMFAVILPSLIDRPNAMLQWMALGRTALELEEKFSWTVASEYITQLLGERIVRHEGFAGTSMEVMTNVTVGVPPRNARTQGAGSGPGKTAAGGDANRGPCFDFNGGGCARPTGTCRFQHICANCLKGGHAAPGCPEPWSTSGKDMASANRRRSGSSKPKQSPTKPPADRGESAKGDSRRE